MDAGTLPERGAEELLETCRFERFERVGRLLDEDEASPPSHDRWPVERAHGALEVEAFLAGTITESEPASAIATGLLALPELLDRSERQALADDVLEIARRPPDALSPADAWIMAVCARPLAAAAGSPPEQLEAADLAALERKGDLVRTVLDESSPNLFLRGRPADLFQWLDADGGVAIDVCLETLETRRPDRTWSFLSPPAFADTLDQLVTLAGRWCPEARDRMAAAAGIAWISENATFRVAPLMENPLAFLELTLEERRA